MWDYLICHAAFVIPVAFACYYTGGEPGKIKHNKKYLDMVITASYSSIIAELNYKIKGYTVSVQAQPRSLL
jgi:hypothetical protein